MCGIIGATANQDILPILIDGLKRLEYRGYDSAGVAVINKQRKLSRTRSVGKIIELERALQNNSAIRGHTGIAHTRWATHGPPTEVNAHPHLGGRNLALVCNGIIENFEQLRNQLIDQGHHFSSQTDTEVIVNQIHQYLLENMDLCEAVKATVCKLKGAYAFAVVCADQPNRLLGARRGSPLVVGIGENATYIASEISALVSVTNDFFILEDGDIVDIVGSIITIIDQAGQPQKREKKISHLSADVLDLGEYRHYMEKEIFEQPQAISDTLEGRIAGTRVLKGIFGTTAETVFDRIKHVQIIACGTSYHAGMVAKYWFENYGIPCAVEIASEFRSRQHAIINGGLVIALSQSGETLDTLSALKVARQVGFEYSLCICNVPESALVRESDLAFMTHAGPEIGVASTKAFTTQLVALRLLVIELGRRFKLDRTTEAHLVKELRQLPAKIDAALGLEPAIKQLATQFADKQHALFLGRGKHYPIALEGALKLKEISYIHAEAYPAGELKHGPLALVDHDMPVISVAPNDRLLDKLKANIEEVRARGGKLIVFADPDAKFQASDNMQVIEVAPVDSTIAPIIYTLPLQLLAYHVALIKGTDVDKPRNLAKSVTVE